MKDANAFGFLPGNDGVVNAQNLQKALDGGGVVCVEQPGIYDLAETILLDDDTELIFGKGVSVRRVRDAQGEQRAGYVLINRGAYSGACNHNITVRGMHLICNGLEIGLNERERQDVIPGLRGQLAFFHVGNLVVEDFTCLDLLRESFAIHICTFQNVRVENVHIEGDKDGVHLGRGRGFVIRSGRFRTFDDPIALNAHDYATSNPQLGWIEDGLIEDCYDLDADSTTGFFCRILAGSWVEWFADMPVQHSDTVIANGRLYRVSMQPDGRIYHAHHCPSHEKGVCEVDGIRWVMVQDDPIHSCGCRNIRFKDIHLQKKRSIAFSIHFDHDNWSRSVYPGSQMPVQENLIFENIFLENEIPVFLSAITPVDGVQVIRSELNGSEIHFSALPDRAEYPCTQMAFSAAVPPVIRCEPGRSVSLIDENIKNLQRY